MFPFFDRFNLAINEAAIEAYFSQFFPHLSLVGRLWRKREGDNDLGALGKILEGIPYLLRGFWDHWISTLPTMELPEACVEEFYVVCDFGHGTDC
ncbi:hypothetical protein ES703_93439 [subsurface metagenome]